MSIEPNFLNDIERYLQDELTSPEREAFEEKIKQDPSLAQEVENHRTAIFLIKAGAVQTMKKKLEQYSEYNTSPEKTSSVIFNKWYVWAAAASVAIVISVLLLRPYEKKDPDKIFIAYFKPPATDRQILRGDSITNEKTQAFLSYEQGHYKEALAFYEKALKGQSGDELLFYAAASALGDGQSAKAIAYLNELLKEPTTLYRSRAQWYLSLAYLKDGQLEKSKPLLDELGKQPGSYNERAKNLLEDLN